MDLVRLRTSKKMNSDEESLAYPLFFAARGRGAIHHAQSQVPFSTKSKVLFSGLGADE